MHDNDTTDAENRPVTTDDLDALYKRITVHTGMLTALVLAAVGGVAGPGTQPVLFVGAFAFMWLAYAIRWSGVSHRLWNASLGRSSSLHIDETVEEMLDDGGEPA